MKNQRTQRVHPEQRRTVFVGLSGGVDSSVSAALLKEKGYNVTGVFIKVWHEDAELTRKERRGTDAEEKAWRELVSSGCTMADDRLDAMRVCAKLCIPFKELNLEKVYKKEVVDYMIREYKAGKTPNPDVMCNRFIKFGRFYEWAVREGADFVATGHYARVSRILSNKKISKQTLISEVTDTGLSLPAEASAQAGIKDFGLFAGSDPQKDQSYFLWQIRREQLPHILFPVGGMKKAEVRKLAKKFGLVTADKKDSQGLCFIGKVDMKDFLSHYIHEKAGNVLDEEGKVVGRHTGATFYTIGERFGSIPQTHADGTPVPEQSSVRGVARTNAEKRRYYVAAKNMKENILTVSQKTPSGALSQQVTEVVIKDCNWVSGEPTAGRLYQARVRYRQPLQECRIMKYEVGGKRLSGITHTSELIIWFSSAQTVAPGQSLVLYDGEVLLGGGIIC